MSIYLRWILESRCPPELPIRPSVPYQLSVDGRVALIDVGTTDHPAIWRVPVERLQWALSLCPVTLKRLPRLEGQELKEIRRLRLQLKRSPFLTSEQRRRFVADITELERQSRGAYEPTPRYSLTKSINGEDVPIHRLFVDARPGDGVTALDGDYLNFDVMKVRITIEPVPIGGVAVGKYRRPPAVESQEFDIPNLVVNASDEKSQRAFEKEMLQTKETLQGDVDETPLKVQPNATWRAGCFGQVVNAGKFDPLSKDDSVPVAHIGRESLEGLEATKKRKK